jgi:hypothetical protein
MKPPPVWMASLQTGGLILDVRELLCVLRTNNLNFERKFAWANGQHGQAKLRGKQPIMMDIRIDETKPKGDVPGRSFVTAIERGLSVMRAFQNQSDRMTLSDVARLVELPRATTRRCLLTLRALGYVAPSFDTCASLSFLQPLAAHCTKFIGARQRKIGRILFLVAATRRRGDLYCAIDTKAHRLASPRRRIAFAGTLHVDGARSPCRPVRRRSRYLFCDCAPREFHAPDPYGPKRAQSPL